MTLSASAQAPRSDCARHARVLDALRAALGPRAVQGPGPGFAGRRHGDLSHMPCAQPACWPQATILIYGHLGDGNIHVVVQEPDWPAQTGTAVQQIVFAITGELNGSVSAEHGHPAGRKAVCPARI